MYKILDDICGYSLDEEQRKVVVSNSKNILVCAGAGSGKTLTIIGKIRYLIEEKKYKEKDILVISFTNETVNSLKDKLFNNYNYNIDVLTFHKLGMKILENTNYQFTICASNYLEYIIEEYFNCLLLNSEKWMRLILKNFKIKYKDKNSYIDFINSNNYKYKELKENIIRFIRLFKSKNYTIDEFYFILKKANKKIFNRKKEIFILRLILDIYLFYNKELESSGQIDFDDMINLSLTKVDYINFTYKYIIIDEYQDTSFVKFKLIKKMVDKLECSFMAVGDDFQSIYRFTGCDLYLFINFDKYFKESEILKITNTYRSPYQLINIAGNFIMLNKKQIKKELKANKYLEKPLTIIVSNNQTDSLKKILLKLKDEVMIIGRNNFDIYKVIDNDFEIIDLNNIIFKNNKNLKIRYFTAHKSKGLESNNVIIINVVKDEFGFPNLKKDNLFVRYVNNYNNSFYLDEERRLFYVALTRTKNNVFLITRKNKESVFIKELVNKYHHKINIITYN